MKEEIIIDTEVVGADKAEKQLEDLAKATNKADEASEEYGETLGDLAKETEVFGVSIDGLSSGFKNSVGAIKSSVKGLNSFKIALASTGIGLLVIALGSLVAWMKNTQEGMNFLEDALATIGAVVDNITGLFTQLGSAIVKVFKGDFKGAIETASDGITGFVENVKNSITATLALNQAVRDLQILSANFSVIQAVNNQEIAKNKRIIEDTTKATNDRIKSAERNKELIAENAQASEDLAFQELENARAQINIDKANEGRTKETIEETQLLAGLINDTINAGTEGQEKVIEFEVKLNELYALRKQEAIDAKNAVVDLSEETIRATNTIVAETDKEAEAYKEAQKAKTKAYFEYQAEVKKGEEEKLELARINAEIEFMMTAELFGAIAGLAGQDSVLGKALAIAQAIMNTHVGITSALALPTITQKILGVSIASAIGLKAVADIRGTPLPEVTINTTSPFGRGGMIYGDSHNDRSGGTMVLAEGGESIINKRSTSMFKPLLNQINLAGGGIPIMANGGMIPDSTGVNPFTNMERALQSARTVLVLDDLDSAQANEFVTRVTTTL